MLEAKAGLFLILFIINAQMHTLSVYDTVYSSEVIAAWNASKTEITK